MEKNFFNYLEEVQGNDILNALENVSSDEMFTEAEIVGNFESVIKSFVSSFKTWVEEKNINKQKQKKTMQFLLNKIRNELGF